MQHKPALPRLLAALFAGLLVTGCTDGLVAPELAASEAVVSSGTNQIDGKGRHLGLIEQATRRSEGIAGKGKEELRLIIKVKKNGLVERYKVLERYKLIERYKLVERYAFDDVIGGFAISVSDGMGFADYNAFLTMLEADPDIAWYEPDFMLDVPGSDATSEAGSQVIPWSVAAIGGRESWAVSGDGQGDVPVDVYVVDTGVARAFNDDSEDDLTLVENVDLHSGVNAADHDGHGTHIAGIIGAVDDTDNVVGVAPGARIHNFRVLGDDGTTDASVVIEAVQRITAAKLANPSNPVIVNLSLGEHLGNSTPTALDEAVEASIAAGVHYVVAAGNEGRNASHGTPAKVREAVTVGSYDVSGVFSSFSNFGPAVDILAPGEGIVSLTPGGGQTTQMSGTSMAAAHVTGALALYVAKNPEATPEEAKAHILSTAQEFVMGPSSTTRKSVWVGSTPAGSTTAPAFLEYAVFAGEKIELDDATVSSAVSGRNANIHSNEEVKVQDDDARVYGFGTFVDKIRAYGGVFRPATNPGRLANYHTTSTVSFEQFDAEDHAGLATKTHSGNLKLKNDFALGTADSPAFIFVDGDLVIDDDLRISGSGAIFVTGKIDVKDDLDTDGPGMVGLFATKDITIDGDARATFVSGASLKIDEDVELVGSVAAFKTIQVKEDVRLEFAPLSESIAGQVWR